MENKKYPIKAKNIIPIYGFAKYMNGTPLTDDSESSKILKRTLGLAYYNVLFSVSAAFALAKGLEALIK